MGVIIRDRAAVPRLARHVQWHVQRRTPYATASRGAGPKSRAGPPRGSQIFPEWAHLAPHPTPGGRAPQRRDDCAKRSHTAEKILRKRQLVLRREPTRSRPAPITNVVIAGWIQVAIPPAVAGPACSMT